MCRKEVATSPANIDFAGLFHRMTLTEKVDLLRSISDDTIQNYVPTYALKHDEKCPWKNKELQLLKNRKKLWNQLKRNVVKEPYDVAFSNFDKLNTDLSYVKRMKSSLKQDPTTF